MNGRRYLVRHARAEAKSASGDAARRLTPEGAADFERHVRSLAADLHVSRVVTSPLDRARETGRILAAAAGAGLVAEASAELSPGASDARQVLALAARLGPGAALVGHNPELGDAVSALAGRRVDFPPGAVAALDVAGNGPRLAWLCFPGGSAPPAPPS